MKAKDKGQSITPRHLGKMLAFIFVSVLALIWLVPIIMMLVVSFMPPDQRAPRFGGLLISGVSIDNYVTVFRDAPIAQHFINSIAVTIPSVFLVVVISSLAAFALARLKFFRARYLVLSADHDLDAADTHPGRAHFSNQQGAGTD